MITSDAGKRVNYTSLFNRTAHDSTSCSPHELLSLPNQWPSVSQGCTFDRFVASPSSYNRNSALSPVISLFSPRALRPFVWSVV
jgi:hypothetical protein